MASHWGLHELLYLGMDSVVNELQHEPVSDRSNHNATAGLTYKPDAGRTFTFTVSYSHRSSDNMRTITLTQAEGDETFNTTYTQNSYNLWDGEANYSFPLLGSEIEVGTNLSWIGNKYSYAFSGSTQPSHRDDFTGAWYGSWNRTYGNWKPEIDRYQLTDEPEMLFANMYWYVTQEMVRRKLARNVSIRVTCEDCPTERQFSIYNILTCNQIIKYQKRVEECQEKGWWKPGKEYDAYIPNEKLFGLASYTDKDNHIITTNGEIYEGLLHAINFDSGSMNPSERKLDTMHPFPFEDWALFLPGSER